MKYKFDELVESQKVYVIIANLKIKNNINNE